MKIYINREPVQGPWGGGNKSVTLLVNKLGELGHTVVYQLEPEIDVIFCIDPRQNNHGEWYQTFLDYRQRHGVKIIQRVGDIGTHGKPDLTQLVMQSTAHSDFIIFPSDWARKAISYQKKNYAIIKNRSIGKFHEHKSTTVKIDASNVKIVTHHWSTNPKKGFKIYEELGRDLSIPGINVKVTYIGRIPDNFNLGNIDYISPKDDDFLAHELPKHDIYLTASEHEAGANHVLEAAACGLPILYHELGGSIPEYVAEFGTEYSDVESLKMGIIEMVKNYSFYKQRTLEYDEILDRSIDGYCQIICQVT